MTSIFYIAFKAAIVPAGSGDLKTVLPATSTSAPAARMEAAFARVTPPSTSINT